ncbi:MAG: HAD family hydrolase [Phycisphaerales bacterium]|nr:HAD family hydrolase [Phycisphaerales bacterium]
MHEWVESPSLRGHMEAVAACMGAYAAVLAPGEADRWTVAGLLHDFDYERHPTPSEHPFIGVKELERLGVDAEIRTAILGHAQYSGVPRTTPMARCLFAVDELAGFIVACAKVRPAGLSDLEPRSVKKKLKDRSFAAAVSREDIALGLAEFGPVGGVDETAHLQVCITALRTAAAHLGVPAR